MTPTPISRPILARAVEIFDRLRTRVGREAAMEQAIEYATDSSKRISIASHASGIDPMAVTVIESVALAHGYTVRGLRGPVGGRYQWATPVRDEAVYLARALTGVSFPALGRFFKRDSSTLVFGARRFEARLASDDILRTRIERAIAAAQAVRAAGAESIEDAKVAS